jgi:hypothetical protein
VDGHAADYIDDLPPFVAMIQPFAFDAALGYVVLRKTLTKIAHS